MWTADFIIDVVLAVLAALLVWAILVGDVATYLHDRWSRHHPRPRP